MHHAAASKKRKSLTYSVPQSIWKENLGVHWPNYGKKRHCEVCAKDKQEACPHIKYSACDVFLCLNERKIVLQSFMTCKWTLALAFYVAIVKYFVSIYKEK